MTLSNHLDVMNSNNKQARSLLDRLDHLLLQFDGPAPMGDEVRDNAPPAPSFHSMFTHGNTEMETLLARMGNTIASLENSIGVTSGTVPSSFKLNPKKSGSTIDMSSLEKSLG